MIFETLSRESPFCNDTVAYRLDEIKSRYSEVKELVEDSCWLALNFDEACLEYALFEFAGSGMDGSDVQVTNVFYGQGTLAPLREMRHTWFCGGGYVFYMSMKNMRLAFNVLEKYFDVG